MKSTVEIPTYLNQSLLPYLFCPGCGHGPILDHLNAALTKLQIDPKKVVIVSDIGCSGLSDKYFNTNAFHGLHGRSVTYATGIKLVNPELKVIVLIGDGGCGIGGHHIINAARRNIGITVLVFNNLNYGMTGGSHSVSTPTGAITATTRYGQLEQPMDICQSVAVNGASFVARKTSFEHDLPDVISDAVRNNGFSLIDIWELCTAHYVPNNKFSKKALEKTLQELDFSTGIIHKKSRPEYSQAYRAIAEEITEPPKPPKQIKQKYNHLLSSPKALILAGAAGKKIVTAASTFNLGAILSGLWATQRNDHPVTVMSGFSLSEVILSPQKILFTGVVKPDILVILFPEGLNKTQPLLKKMTSDDIVYINRKLLPIDTEAKIIPLNFIGGKDRFWAMRALEGVVRHTNIYHERLL